MAAISPAFRYFMYLNQAWTYVVFYMLILVVGILITVTTECSILGKTQLQGCVAYSWILSLMIVVSFVTFVVYTVIKHVQEKKEVKEERKVNTTIPLITAETFKL